METKKIGECLKLYFRNNGKTQEDIASTLGVTHPRVNSLLNGKPFGKKEAVKWELLFGINALWLMTGRGPMLTDGSTPDYITEMVTNTPPPTETPDVEALNEGENEEAERHTLTTEQRLLAQVESLTYINNIHARNIAELIAQQGRLIALLENTKK